MNTELPKILIVDDDATMRQVLRWILDDDFNVQTAASMGQARQFFATSSEWCAIVSDHHLPDGTGLELHAWIREQSPVPFLLITGGLKSAPLQALNFGFLKKPFDGPALRKELALLLELQPALR